LIQKASILPLCATALIVGCGDPAPSSVQLFVNTIPSGASCAIALAGQSVSQIESTPGIALVPNQEADYVVSCSRSGHADISGVVHSRTEERSFRELIGGGGVRSVGGGSITFTLVPRENATR
jgi:hypothetical protein